MKFKTGQTIYEQVMSLDVDNNPISAATFDSVLYLNNSLYTAYTPSYYLSDASRGVFSFSWSADTIGMYQLYARNNSTGVVFVSDIVNIRPDSEFDTNVYIGL